MAALLVVPLVACDEDDDTPQQPTQVNGTVRGTVTVEGEPLAGVNVSLAGASSQSATTGSDGSYQFAGVPGGSYSVTLSSVPEGVTFPNIAKSTSISSNGQTVTVDFSGSYIRTSSISGTVSAGGGVSGATVTATGPDTKSATTDNAGDYSITGLRAGEYTVEVSDLPEGTELTSSSKTVSLSAGQSATVNFSGTGASTAKVSIERITWGNTNTPVPTGSVAGQVDFTVEVDEGNDNVTRLSLLIDGEEVAFQTFSASGAPAQGENVAAAPEAVEGEFQVVFSVNTAALERDADGNMVVEDGHASVRFPDGNRPVSAAIDTQNGGTSSASSGTELTFTNAAPPNAPPGGFTVPVGNRVIVSFDTDNGDDPDEATDAGGFLWNGGSVMAEGAVVSYNNTVARSVTLTLNDVVNGVASSKTDSDPSDGFTAMWPESSTFANGGVGDRQVGNQPGSTTPGMNFTASSVTTGGNAGPGGVAQAPFRIDNVAGSMDNLHNATPATRWVSGNDDDNDDPWNFQDLVNATGGILVVDRPATASSTGATGRVGSGIANVYFRSSSSLSDLTGSDPIDPIDDAEGLAETFDPDRNFLQIQSVDLLGNMDTRYYAGVDTDGVDDEDDAEETGYTSSSAVSGDANARHGVDHVDPTESLTSNSLENGDFMGGTVNNTDADDHWSVSFQDTRSGFTATPVNTKITRHTPTVSGAATCAFGNDADGNIGDGFDGCVMRPMGGLFDFRPSVGANPNQYNNSRAGWGSNPGESDAYYHTYWNVDDEALNTTTQRDQVNLLDTTPGSLGGFTMEPDLDAGEQETFSTQFTDNLDADEALFFLRYGGGFWLHQATENLGEFGYAEFTRQGTLSSTSLFSSHLQNIGNTDGAITNPAGMPSIVADQARFRMTDFAENLVQRSEALTTVNGTARDYGTGTTDERITGVAAYMGDRTPITAGGGDDDALCADFGDDGCSTNPTSQTVTLLVEGESSDVDGNEPLDNQFSEVVFVIPMSGVPAAAAATATMNDPIGWRQVATGSLSITDPGNDPRQYFYSATLSVDDLVLGPGASDGDVVTVWAIAIADDGATRLITSFDFSITEE